MLGPTFINNKVIIKRLKFMGKKKTTTATKSRCVMLGDMAYSFYDASTGIFIGKGDKKTLTARQLNSTKIKKALHTGHLQYTTDDSKPAEKYNEEAIEAMVARFESMMKSGMEATKIAQGFSDEEVDKIAAEYNITRDEGDTSVDVITAIIIDLESKGEE